MARTLPWENRPEPGTPKIKGAPKVQRNDWDSSQSDHAAVSTRKRKYSESNQSDHQDDDNWRMTESELVATAKLWTKELHQQAYDKVLRTQQKEQERSRALTYLLDEPGVEQQILPLPPRIAVTKPKPELGSDIVVSIATKKPESKDDRMTTTAGHEASTVRRDEDELSGTVDSESITSTAFPSNATVRSALPKLSKAALARRQKREKGCQNDNPVAPMF